MYKEQRPSQIPLTATWPYDANAPIPLALLISEILANDTPSGCKAKLLERLKHLPFWQETGPDWHKKQQAKVMEAMTQEGSPLADRLDHLIARLKCVLTDKGHYGVPVLIVPQVTRSIGEIPSHEKPAEEAKPDPIETFFVRINCGGTPLEGEELIYSLIKSHWTEAPKFIERLQHKLAVPSRIVLLCARLVLARAAGTRTNMPASPSVSEFRRLMRGLNTEHPNFVDDLKDFVRGNGVKIFETVHRLLTEGNHALPPVLATELVQKAPDVFFLVLRWIDLMLQRQLDPLALNEAKRRQLIGFLAALAWFAPDKGKAVAAVWPDLKAEADDLEMFFDRSRFVKTLTLSEHGSFRMIPLPPPELLERVIATRVTSGAANYPGIGKPDSTIWTQWNRWTRLIESLPKDLTGWYEEKISERWRSRANTWEDGLPAIYGYAWQSFLNNLWDNRLILLYAQREWMNRWFPDFDPSQPENLEDKNRPWDYDHIHPQKYLRNDDGSSRRNIPAVIREWHGSIGNLRAWPLEANRADGSDTPGNKLSGISDEEKRYGITDVKSERSASFVGTDDWPLWQMSAPQEKSFPPNYLAHSDHFSCRKALIEAITIRFVALYREWYKTLCLGKLMP